MVAPSQPSNLELQALTVLWRLGPSTVSTVHEELPDGKDRAYTTVLSVMQSLERKKLVQSMRVGRAHQYKPSLPREQIVGHAMHEFVTNAFGGSSGDAILAILSAGGLSPEEKTEIKRELERNKTMAAKKTAKKAAKAPAKKAPAKKAVKKVAKKAPAKKAPAKKAATKAPATKAVKKKAAKSAKKVAKKAAKKTVVKPAKKAAKKAAQPAPAKKAVKKAATKAPAKKAAKKAAKNAPAKKAAKNAKK